MCQSMLRFKSESIENKERLPSDFLSGNVYFPVNLLQ